MALEKRFREQRRKIEAMFAAEGITRFEYVESSKGHYRVVFYRDGNPRAYHVGFGNSDDWRAHKNSLSDLRHRLEESKYVGHTGNAGHPGVPTTQRGQHPTGHSA